MERDRGSEEDGNLGEIEGIMGIEKEVGSLIPVYFVPLKK